MEEIKGEVFDKDGIKIAEFSETNVSEIEEVDGLKEVIIRELNTIFSHKLTNSEIYKNMDKAYSIINFKVMINGKEFGNDDSSCSLKFKEGLGIEILGTDIIREQKEDGKSFGGWKVILKE